MSNLLEMKDVVIEGHINERWRPIIKGLSLTLKRGEVVGLIGESGAGKSTFGLAAMGYTREGCRIKSGSIVFDGKDLGAMPKAEVRKLCGSRIAYVAQSAAASFNPAHTLMAQFVEIPVQHHIMGGAEAQKKAVRIYRRLDLPDPDHIGKRYPHQVSGGQLQRAMVAMAMSGDPDVIVFDEPTTALDVTTQIEVLAAIKRVIKERNTAAIYITHDLAIVAQVADRIMVLRYGELVEEGPARELLQNPRQQYTRELLSVRRRQKETAPDSGRNILEVRGVSASYNGRDDVVHEVSFKVARGTTVAVVGESGSGKTSAARVITGLLPPRKGEIVFDGKVLPPGLAQRNKDILRRLQMIYQMPDVALNPRHKVRKILGRPLQLYFGMGKDERETRIKELLEMTELPARYIDRYPSELSGGEKQRICIARALAAEPELVICDEVTSALDQLVAEGILKLLDGLQKELGISYLFITHDLATVKAIADEVIVMLLGRVVEQGEKKVMFQPPHHEYTELLLSSVPEMDPDWLDTLLAQRRAAQAAG